MEGKGVEKVMRRMHGFLEVRRLHSANGRWDMSILLSSSKHLV